MAGVPNSDLLDLTRTTLQNLPDLEFEVALDYQEYPVCNIWFKSDKKEIDSGTEISRRIILDTSGNARHVRLYQKTPINVANVQEVITAPWVQVQTHWSIERREALRNRAPARYVELISSRRADATVDLADLLERRAWSAPSSSSDDLNPRGIPYWLSHEDNTSGDQEGGFNGDTIRFAGGTTSTTKGGIDGTATGKTKWTNWVATYSSINATFVKRLRKAFHATNFVSPMLAKDVREGPASRFRLYMNLNTLTDYEDLATKQNDNLGKDLDPFHGMTTFRRVPIIYTPQLDGFSVTDSTSSSFTSDPVFGVNHSKFFPITMEDDWMRESEPMTDVEQNNVMTTFVDGSYQFFCNNIRAGGFVLHKAIP